jgi:hypothetical protein
MIEAAAPMPRDPPVINATLPVKSIISRTPYFFPKDHIALLRVLCALAALRESRFTRLL